MRRKPQNQSDPAPSDASSETADLPVKTNESAITWGELIDSQRKLRSPEAAAYLGVALSTLVKMRHFGSGPPYYKISKRTVVYDRTDLDRWLREHRRQSTSEHG